MTRLPDLHRQLVDAARRQEETPHHAYAISHGHRDVHGWHVRGRLRLFAFTLVGLLASTTIALAASGVITIGSPVPADKGLHRESGLGVPVKSGSFRLEPLRVADPYGGPPWGMRVVRTSREEVCLQIGRIQDGELGELGVDGAFHNDGELHPRPASALPDEGRIPSISNQNTHCALAGEASSVADLVVPSSAVPAHILGPHPTATLEAMPRGDLRDLYFGLLGPQALSVTYRIDGSERTQAVAPSGAYLIVLPLWRGQSLRDFGTSTGAPYGDLTPGPGELLDKITYRINGRLCERALHWVRTPVGAWRSTEPALAHPCPQQGESPPLGGRTRPLQLHQPVHARLQVKGDLVTGLKISFKAPYAVKSAQEQYSLFLPEKPCHVQSGDIEVEGGADISLNRNIKRGALVTYTIPHPFRVRRLCRRGTVIVRVAYERYGATLGRTIVGEVTIRQPSGTRAR